MEHAALRGGYGPLDRLPPHARATACYFRAGGVTCRSPIKVVFDLRSCAASLVLPDAYNSTDGVLAGVFECFHDVRLVCAFKELARQTMGLGRDRELGHRAG